MPDDNSTTSHFSTADLDWLAFCYVADELDASQRDEFELRLATDQDARDAVCQAMEASQLLFVALKQSQPELRTSNRAGIDACGYPVTNRWLTNRRGKKLLASLAATVALLLLAVNWTWFFPASFNGNEMASVSPSEMKSLQIPPDSSDATQRADDSDLLATAWAMTLIESDSEVDFETMDSVEPRYTNVIFTDESWIVAAVLDLEDDSRTKDVNSSDTETDIDGSEDGENLFSPKALGDF